MVINHHVKIVIIAIWMFILNQNARAQTPATTLALMNQALRINLQVIGPNVNGDKQQRCIKTLEEGGALIDISSTFRVTLFLDKQNRLLLEKESIIILDEIRPQWGMKELCRDALTQIVKFSIVGNGSKTPESDLPPDVLYNAAVRTLVRFGYGLSNRDRDAFVMETDYHIINVGHWGKTIKYSWRVITADGTISLFCSCLKSNVWNTKRDEPCGNEKPLEIIAEEQKIRQEILNDARSKLTKK